MIILFFGRLLSFFRIGSVHEFQQSDLFLGQESPFSSLHVLFREVGVHDAVEVSDIVSQLFKHPSDDPVLTAMYFDADHRMVFGVCKGKRVGLNKTVLQGNAVLHGFEIFFHHRFVQSNLVYLSYLVAGMRKFLGKIPVIGQQQYPGGIPIEPAYGINPFRGSFFNQVHHGSSSLGIFYRSDMVFRFVQQDIDQLFAGGQFLSLCADIIFF